MAARVHNLIENKKLMDQVEEQQKRLEEMAVTDQLTGLLNRRHLQEVTTRLTSEAMLHKTPLRIMVIDLGRFKQVNDVHGHATGDCVLVDVAYLLKESCRQEDFAVCYGVRSFFWCCPNATVRMQLSVQIPFEQDKPAGLHITASLGIAELLLEPGFSFDNDA